jgi:hypothetical protein
MSDGKGHIDARDATIDNVVQINAPHNRGSISTPVLPGPGRTVFAINHTPSRESIDNLAAASATINNNFIGRVKQLNDLASHINRVGGPTAVVIVAGAGFGKTELAKHFINTRAKPAPAGADASALAPDQWTARWWLDGSKSGEAASLKLHYTTITGQPFPDEPRPAPGEDPAKVEAAFRTSLRKAIATACSTGRQLLVIDNAETTQQISEYTPGNASRLIATTRRQPIPKAVGHEFPLEVMSETESRELLAHARPDLQTPAHVAALDAIATHLGHHALALAYAAAALARPPFKTPQAVLSLMQAADVGAEGDILAEFGEDALGTQYKLGLAQSLSLLLDELADAALPTHDARALALAALASFCAPSAIPISLLVAASGEPEAAVEASLRALHERSIITLTDTVSLHRLTQSLLRGRLRRAGGDQCEQALARLLSALIDLFQYPAAYADQLLDHTKTPARLAAVAHAEAVIAHAETFVRDAGTGADAPFPRTPTPAMHATAARLRAELTRWLASIGQLADAARHIDAAIRWGEAQSPRDERSLAIQYSSRARIRLFRGDPAGAEEDIQKSIAWGEAQTPRDERILAIDYASRASIRQYRGDLPGAEADIARSIAWAEDQSPRDERSLAVYYASRANIRHSRGLLTEAEADTAKSIAWEESQTPRNERELAIRYASRASIRQSRGDLAGAEEDIQRSIAWHESQSPRDERSLAISYASRASIRQFRGNLSGAEADIAKSITWGEAQTPSDERSLAIWYASRASIRQSRGDLHGAEADIGRSVAWCEAQTPRDERGMAVLYASRASILQVRGDLQGAEADIARTIEWGESQTPRDERSLATRYALRASIRQLRGDLPGAEADIGRSIAWCGAQTPRDERSQAILYASRARILRDRGDLGGAEADIAASIAWEESQTEPNQRELASRYASRASIRQDRGDLLGAEADIARAIAWGEAQAPRDERSLAIQYATRAKICQDKAIAARMAGYATRADTLFALATADIAAALTWWEQNLPQDERGLGILRQDQASIDKAAKGE